ncbi:MAG TPA: beta-galactosidase [bacterium]|nr:beta-galactosidase [bacterium]HPP29631.1 beta-galactosidase [bacterium]
MGRIKKILLCSTVISMLISTGFLYATAPYGDPNQPYDKLPGTFETYHVEWATPLPEGKLKILFIVPYNMSREVVELKQRLDLEYTVIMNVCRSSWWEGYREGGEASPIANGEEVLDKIVDERLDSSRKYDAIVIGKVSWEIMPEKVKGLILEHIRKGTALIYVSPHRATSGWRGITPQASAPDPQYEKLFLHNDRPDITEMLTEGLPFDVIPLTPVNSVEEGKKLPPSPVAPGTFRIFVQKPVNIRITKEGNGTILVLDYCDDGVGNSLTSGVLYNPVMYDYEYALLARCILYAVKGESGVKSSISFNAPETVLKAPEGIKMPAGWDIKSPRVIISRDDLKDSRIVMNINSTGMRGNFVADIQIRDEKGNVLKNEKRSISLFTDKSASVECSIPVLPRGTYFADVRIRAKSDGVISFASAAFRVETPVTVVKIETDKPYYKEGEDINGKVLFSQPIGEGLKAEATAIDTWGRAVARVNVTLSSDRKEGLFTIPVKKPLSRLWDIVVEVKDISGTVSENRVWVGLPDWDFDDYYIPLIFSAGPVPGDGWRGYFYTQQVRKYGINANNTYLIYGLTDQYEHNERAHLVNITYGEHLGENGLGTGTQFFSQETRDTEYTGPSLAELVDMMEDALSRDGKIDTQKFPEMLDFSAYRIGGAWINSRMESYREILKFGTPYAFLTGENYLLGEPGGYEISGFSPASTRRFQQWCKEEYKGDINALNEEWGTSFKDWSEIRGILFKDAYKAKQLPRWVAFRYFMRSRIWSEFFIRYTEMIRKNIGYQQLLTGTNGHEHHDHSRYRDAMTSGKLYVGQQPNWEYRTCAGEELRQSFSGDKSFLLAAQSMMMLNFDQKTPLNNHRLPWKALFAGYRGFDWEAGSASANSLGGMCCMTPDFSEPLPFFKNISEQVLYLQRGIGKLCITSKAYRSDVAILWSLPNHYISRLHPRQEQGFSGGWLYNIDVDGGAITDILVLMKNIRIRPTFVAPEDVVAGDLIRRGFRALILPYNKGMSDDEAKAILAFVEQGGLVIADNQPGIFTRFGKMRNKPVLADLFPVTDRENIVHYGKGVAAYMPGVINGYLSRMEKGDYAGSDSVALLLEKYAGIRPFAELIDGNGKPRRDTLMPVYMNGTSRFLGMLRADTSAGKETEETKVILNGKFHIWNVRERKYLGYADSFDVKLDMYPKFFALLPANPVDITVKTDTSDVKEGDFVKVEVMVKFKDGSPDGIKNMGQVIHLAVYGPDGEELLWYGKNIHFYGERVNMEIPVSYTERPGRYRIVIEYPITGMSASTHINVVK